MKSQTIKDDFELPWFLPCQLAVLFFVDVAVILYSLSVFGSSVFQSQDHTSVILCEKYSTSRQKSLCSDWLVLAPLEIGIWSGQTDCYVDLIGIAIFSCSIICARQTNGTARSQLWGLVNFCPRILKQRLDGVHYKDIDHPCTQVSADILISKTPIDWCFLEWRC
jgi:hypothetical protein